MSKSQQTSLDFILPRLLHVACLLALTMTSSPVRGAETLYAGSCIAEQIEGDLEKAGPYWGVGAYAFFDNNLSRDRSLACSSCHTPDYAYANPEALRDTASGLATRHAPSLLNIRDQRWFFWDGRASSLDAAILHPLYGTTELNLDKATLAERVSNDPNYALLFDPVERNKWLGVAPGGEVDQTIERALARSMGFFLRTLVSCETTDLNSSGDEVEGRMLFHGKAGCANCHFGNNFTDGRFHNIRMRPSRNFADPDSGRYAVVKAANSEGAKLKLTQEMWGAFKTPGLRNVARHPPYMHQGQLGSLEEVVRFYSDFQNALPEDHHYAGLLRPLQLTEVEIAQLVVYLESLNDTYYTCLGSAEGATTSPSVCKFEVKP